MPAPDNPRRGVRLRWWALLLSGALLLAALLPIRLPHPVGGPRGRMPRGMEDIAPVTGAIAASRTPAWGRGGMVVSPSPWATEAGVEVLREGGNAIDAAVAVSLALGVTEQYLSGIGGGSFLLLWMAEQERAVAIDAREKAPAAAGRDMFLRDGVPVPDLSTTGPLAIAVPGALAGWGLALDHFGTLPLERVIAPAIRLAEEGFPIGWTYRSRIAEKRDKLLDFPATAQVYLGPAGGIPDPDFVLRQPTLAATYRHLAEAGWGDFYQGAIADSLAAFVQASGGLLTREDLASYAPVVREPLVGTYRGATLLTMPPPSSGGVHLLQVLNILEGYDVAALGAGSSATFHLLAEAMKRAFADRAVFLGDPDFVDVPVKGLTSKEYARRLRRGIEPRHAHGVRGPGDPFRYEPEEGGTSHLVVADRWGNIACVTQTVNLYFGSGLQVPSLGVILNDEMDDFTVAPGVPNDFGLVGGEANAIASGKRPLSSMTPVLILEEGQAVLALGGRGGPKIITSVCQVLLDIRDFGMDLQEAVDAPRMHHQWRPDEVVVERAVPADVVRALERRGHRVRVQEEDWGGVQAVLIDRDAGVFWGAADPRTDGSAVGLP